METPTSWTGNREFVVRVKPVPENIPEQDLWRYDWWTYQTMAKSHGHAVQRIVWHTGWEPCDPGFRYIVTVSVLE
jgi:hypothetical protein